MKRDHTDCQSTAVNLFGYNEGIDRGRRAVDTSISVQAQSPSPPILKCPQTGQWDREGLGAIRKGGFEFLLKLVYHLFILRKAPW
jgi:hypothetical protein